jgi:uncharacterized membrane protein
MAETETPSPESASASIPAAPAPPSAPPAPPRWLPPWAPVARYEIAVLVLIILLAAGLRSYHLGAKSFWVDELIALERARTIEQATVEAMFGHEPPLRYYLIHYLARWKPAELYTRLPSYVLGVAAIPMLWLLARMLFGGGVALVSAFLLAIWPWHILESQDSRMYAVMLFLWLASLALFFAALDKPQRSYLWPLLALVNALNFLLSYLTAFVMAAEILVFIGWLAVRKGRHRSAFPLRPYLAGAFIYVGFFGMAISSWIQPLFDLLRRYLPGFDPLMRLLTRTQLVTPRYTTATFGKIREEWPAELGAAFYNGLLDRLLLPGPFWRVVTVIGVAIGLALCWRRNRLFVIVGVLSFALAIVAFATTEARHFVSPRYTYFVLLFVLVAFAMILVTVAERFLAWASARALPRRYAIATLAAGALALLAPLAPTINLYVQVERQYWKLATRYLVEHMGPDEILITGPYGSDYAVHYYDPGEKLWERRAIVLALSAPDTEKWIDRAQSGAWYITWGGYIPDILQLVLQTRLRKVVMFPGLDGTIYIYKTPDKAKSSGTEPKKPEL